MKLSIYGLVYKGRKEMAIFTMDFINEYTKLKSSDKQKITLYRLHHENQDGKLAIPKIPDNYFTKNGYEENKTPRVCFGPSIGKCLMALSRNCTNEEYYVHIPEPGSNFDVYKPTLDEVPDSGVTGELWVLNKVKQKCIGKIKVISDDGKFGHKFNYGDGKFAELYGWNWKWIERYN